MSHVTGVETLCAVSTASPYLFCHETKIHSHVTFPSIHVNRWLDRKSLNGVPNPFCMWHSTLTRRTRLFCVKKVSLRKDGSRLSNFRALSISFFVRILQSYNQRNFCRTLRLLPREYLIPRSPMAKKSDGQEKRIRRQEINRDNAYMGEK